MKKLIPLSFMLVLAMVPASLSAVSPPKQSKHAGQVNPPELSTQTQAPQLFNAFHASVGYTKLDAKFRKAWDEAIKKDDYHKTFECILKMNVKPTERELRRLRDNGFTYRTIDGQMLPGSLAAVDVADVANFPFVESLELVVPPPPQKP
jgi:hypothetical protein